MQEIRVLSQRTSESLEEMIANALEEGFSILSPVQIAVGVGGMDSFVYYVATMVREKPRGEGGFSPSQQPHRSAPEVLREGSTPPPP